MYLILFKKGNKNAKEHSAKNYIKWKHGDNLSHNKNEIKLYPAINNIKNERYRGIKKR